MQNFNGPNSYWPDEQDNQLNNQMGNQSQSIYPSWQGYGRANNNPNSSSSSAYFGGYTSPSSSNPLLEGYYKGGSVNSNLPKFGGGGFNKFVNKQYRTIVKAARDPGRAISRAVRYEAPKAARKTVKAGYSIAGGGGGAVLGNMIAPGWGGVLGGAVGQALQNKFRGKSMTEGALKGASLGLALPSAASLVGGGLNSMGYTGAGGYLSDYGAANAVLPSLGFGAAASAPTSGIAGSSAAASGASVPTVTVGNAYNAAPLALSGSPAAGAAAAGTGAGASASAGTAASSAAPKSFLGMLGDNSKEFFSKPLNIAATLGIGAALLNRPKQQPLPPQPREKTPEELASEEKRYALASLMNDSELERWEKGQTGKEQAKRRVERNKFLPEERLGDITPLHRKTRSPEEYRKDGRWFDYYDNPEYAGERMNFKDGGNVNSKGAARGPAGLSFFLEGMSGGQDDDREVMLPDGSYIIDASTTANLGDGNSRAGAEKINALVSDGETYIAPEGVARLGKGDPKAGAALLDRLVKNVRKHKGGSTKLPPKAKSLESYLKKGKM